MTSTPNRCSSSMTTSPRLWKCTSGWASRCVPMTMSIEPSSSRRMISVCCRRVANRDSAAISKGNSAIRAANVRWCCSHKQRGRHEHRHLVAGIDRLERRPHRQFGLAVAHVAAQQPVHRPRQAHVVLDGVDGGQLVGRFVVGERGVELALPFGVGGKGDAGPRRPRRLQFEHVGRQIGHRLLDALLLPLPKPAAELGQRGPALRAADVFLHQADLRGGHVELRPPGELQFQVFLDLPVLFQQFQPAIAGDAVADVDHKIALAQFEETVDHPGQPAMRRPTQIGAAEQLAAAREAQSDREPAGSRCVACRPGIAVGPPARPASRRTDRPAGGLRPRSGRRRKPPGPCRPRPVRRGRD